MKRDDELDLTVDTLIDLDEPEALLTTLQRAAARQKGKRWQMLARALHDAEVKLGLLATAERRVQTPEPDTPPEAA